MEKKSGSYSGYTQARKAANEKYLKSIAEIKLRLPKELKEQIKAAALKSNKSINAFVLDAIKEHL